MTRQRRSRGPARGSARESAVDPLIEQASDEKPVATQAEMLVLDEPRDSDPNAMWKVLMQLKSVLPYISRLLPLLDARLLPLLDLIGVRAGQAQNAGLSKEVREDLAGLQTGQQEIRIAVQDQALEIKRLEDQISGLREAMEKNNFAHAELVEDVKSIRSLIRAVSVGLTVLLVVLILVVGALLTHIAR